MTSLPQIAVLAGGLATRLRPVTETIPKSLIEITGEPFIFHQMRLIAAKGGRDVLLCLGHLGHMVRDAVGDGTSFGLRVSYSFDGDVLLGTGGALRRALPLLDERFLILYGDSYLTCDWQAVADAHAVSGRQALMTVFRNESRWDKSNIDYADGIVRVYDKGDSSAQLHYIDYGLTGCRRDLVSAIPEGQFSDFASVLSAAVIGNQVAGFEVSERFFEVGSFQGIADLEAWLRQHGVH